MATAPLPSATHRVAKQRQPRYLHLTECSFHGTYVTESDLLDFLKAVQPATVTLSNIRVITGTYAAIFNHLTGPDSPVIAYNLGRRHPRGKRSCALRGAGEFQISVQARRSGSQLSLAICRPCVKEAARYRLPPGRPLGLGPARSALVEEDRLIAREFGPLDDARC